MNNLLDLPLNEAPVVVLDTETTGLNPNTGDRVVEIGALRFGPGRSGPWQKQAEFNQLLQPGRRMDPGASRVNKIYDADLAGKPLFTHVVGDLLAFVDGAVIVAHNARFDADFMGMELYIHSLNKPAQGTDKLINPWLCTLQLARRHFYFGRNNLSHIARAMGVRAGKAHRAAHRALNDVYMTVEVLKRMSRELAEMGLISVGDLLHAQGGAIYAPTPAETSLPPLLAEALSKRRPLRIKYNGAYGRSERVIEPHYSTSAGGSVYLIAHCRQSDDQRTFRLDRILSAEIVND
jgi:DNA polymerase-3 subunit epsilon